MSDLKNTPWEADCLQEGADWIVIDSNGSIITLGVNKETAQAIAALPETLSELERLEEAAQDVLDNWESGDGTTRVADLMNNLKKALE